MLGAKYPSTAGGQYLIKAGIRMMRGIPKPAPETKGRRKGSAVDGAELRLVWDDLLPRGRILSADERVGANDVRCG
jgi:hypothetical protein